MTVTSLTIAIAGTNYDIDDFSFSLPDMIEEATKCTFTVLDPLGIFSFSIGQSVVVTDTLEGNIFTGRILSRKRNPDIGTCIYHQIEATDKIDTLNGQTSNRIYNGQYAGAIAVDQIKDQWANGILANFAIDTDTTQADFKSGNLSGTVAANNVDDGNLELAPAGTTATITESTTSVFGSGTLTNCTASGNTLAPTATPTIKLAGTESLTNDANAYIYFKIFTSGAISVINGRYLEYDIQISASSSEIKAGVDIIFTDGSTLRDLSQTYVYYDAQNIAPHPNRDLTGFANGQWYHRKFLLDNFSGKTISHVDVAIEGDKGGAYIAYFKNILYTDGAGTTVNTFFSGSLNTQKQMQNSGYSNASLSVVNTYDCSNSKRVSPSYSISQVGILKSSFFSWTYVQPTNTNILLEYSLDGGNSYTTCTVNAALPNLPAGLSLAGKSIQFRQTFQQLAGASPEDKPILSKMICVLSPSYTASKSDATVNGTTTAQWNAGSLSNTQAANNILLLLGAIRNWDTADLSNMTIFGGGASGPSPTTVRMHCVLKTLWVEVGNSMEGHAKASFTGQWANGRIECDVYFDRTDQRASIEYRRTLHSNYDANYAYAVEFNINAVTLQRGSNSSAASTGVRTQVATASISIASASWHHVTIIFNGSNHQISVDDNLLINATDSTYTAAGDISFRSSNSNSTQGYQAQFQNFGVTVIGLSGTWVSPSQSLTGLGTYLNSVVSWQDVSIGTQNTTILVESTINGGGSFQTVTNGSPIPNLTLGQSLSGVSVQFRITETTASASSMPQVQYFVARVLGGFSSSGTRINKALLLTAVGTCGSTLVSWNALTPTGTSVAFATSLDGTSYTSILNGGSIAGLNQQPAPTIDTFNLISTGSYVNTARTGGTATAWVEDTANSRMTVSGGTNALLIYGAISCKDVDTYFDLDQADNCGVVWRYTDPSNYYELLVFDASSSAGSTNVVKLFKIVANVKTQLGSSTAITLKRSDIVKRARVTMIGTAITVYFDGTSILSTTDSSLAGPGQVGLSNVSGSGRFYNLRIQPQGDNLAGKLVYVKQTLTSTDPTVTPQITDMTALVTNPNIGAGSLIPTADYRNTYKSDNIKDLAKQSNYYYNVKPDGSFIFLPRQTVPAPWVITQKDMLADGLEIDDSADIYHNRHTLTGVQSTIVTSEIHTGDGSSTSFTLKYPVASMTSIVLDGQTKTFGLKGTSGYDFYYAVGDNSIAQDSSGTILQNIIDQLVISYTGQTTTVVTRDNTGQFTGTVSQKQYIDQAGLSIPVQTILNQASAVVSASGNSDDLDVSLVKRVAVDINITAQAGTSPTVQFFVDRKAADGSYDPIWQSSVLSALGPLSTTIGPRCSIPELLGTVIRIRWTIGGSASPSKTFSISIQGRVDASLAGIGIIEAVEDVSSLNLNVAGAQARGDAALQQWGVQGRTFKFRTKRTGLAAGQYASIFHSLGGLNDASMLITSATRTQMFKMEGGQPSQSYFFDITASEASTLTSWGNTLNNALA